MGDLLLCESTVGVCLDLTQNVENKFVVNTFQPNTDWLTFKTTFCLRGFNIFFYLLFARRHTTKQGEKPEKQMVPRRENGFILILFPF